jgi:hypothetical protein
LLTFGGLVIVNHRLDQEAARLDAAKAQWEKQQANKGTISADKGVFGKLETGSLKVNGVPITGEPQVGTNTGSTTVVSNTTVNRPGTVVQNYSTTVVQGSTGNFIQNGTIQQIADFNISGSGTVGTLNATSALQLNGANINTAGTLSNVAYLNGTGPQTFTGNNKFTGTFLAQDASNSTAAFQIQNAAGSSNLLVADTANSRIGLGVTPVTTAGSGLLQVGASGSTTPDQGISFGGDPVANLYRGAAGELDTDGALVVAGPYIFIFGPNAEIGIYQDGFIQTITTNPTDLTYNTSVYGEAFGRLSVTADGSLFWGSGAAATDTNLYRGAANTLQTDDNLLVKTTSNSATAFQIQNSAGTSNLFVANTTNTRIGIGIASPLATLHVSSSGTDPLFRVTDATATARDVLNIADGGAAIFRNQTDSSTAFQIQNAAGSTAFRVSNVSNTLAIVNIGGSGFTDAGLTFLRGTTETYSIGSDATGPGGANGLNIYNEIQGKYVFGLSTNGAAIFKNSTNTTSGFQVQDSSSNVILVVSTNNFSSGANAANATLKLAKDSGTSRSINAAGSINASGADYAEWIPWSGPAPAQGSIVSYLGSSYVVSSPETAAFIGNDKFGEGNSILVTFAGQVPVRVTGAVNTGDLLVDNGDGTAKAVSPASATFANYLSKLGIAQESSTNSGVKPVKAAIGTTSSSVGANLQASNFAGLNVSGMATIGTLHVTGDATIDGTLTVNGHVITGGDNPAAAAGAAAGGGTVAIDGNDTSGTITITTGGTGLTAGDIGSFTFSSAYGHAPRIVISGQDDASAGARIFPSAKTTAGFKLRTGVPLAPHTTYTFDYFIAQ